MIRTSHLPARARKHILAAAALLFLAGCGMVGPTAYQLYTLQPTAAPPAATESVSWSLAVAVPEAPASLDTTRIALSQSATTMDYYAAAQWTDRTPVLVQSKFVEAFEGSGKIKSVFPDNTGLHADYILEPEIRNFEAQYAQPDTAPQIVVKIQSRLVKASDRSIAGTFTATGNAQAQQNNLNSVVMAFDQAVGAALQQTVDWTLRTAPPTEAAPEAPHVKKRWHPVPPPAAATPPANTPATTAPPQNVAPTNSPPKL